MVIAFEGIIKLLQAYLNRKTNISSSSSSARSGKLPILKSAFGGEPNFEGVLIQDVVADDLTEVLKGTIRVSFEKHPK